MKKDIFIPESKGVKLGILPVDNDSWELYMINENEHSIRNILLVSNAKSEDRETSTLRYFLESMAEHSYIKFETIYGEVIELDNSILMTYYVGMDIYEKEFLFSKNGLIEKTQIPILNRLGYMIG